MCIQSLWSPLSSGPHRPRGDDRRWGTYKRVCWPPSAAVFQSNVGEVMDGKLSPAARRMYTRLLIERFRLFIPSHRCTRGTSCRCALRCSLRGIELRLGWREAGHVEKEQQEVFGTGRIHHPERIDRGKRRVCLRQRDGGSRRKGHSTNHPRSDTALSAHERALLVD
jgi:hypothetical protein